MKKYLLILVIGLFAFAPDVPNTSTFRFSQVTMAVYGDSASGRNLTSAFADATGTFDPSYVGSKTNLLNFRNYKATLSCTPPAVGCSYQGGIVAYVYVSGDPGYVSGEVHGIIVSSADVGHAAWWNGSYSVTGVTATALGTGATNTTTIVASQGVGTYAAYLCLDYVSGIYGDWYLPSKDELEKIWINRVAIGGLTPFEVFWTSTEDNSTEA